MIDDGISYNTYMSYRNIIHHYIFPLLAKKKLSRITRKDLMNVMGACKTDSLLRSMYGVLGSSFKYAKSASLIPVNMAITAIRDNRTLVCAKRKKEYVSSVLKGEEAKEKPSLNKEQLSSLLYIAKRDYPDFYIPLLLTATTGCRVSELRAIQFGDIDFKDRFLHIEKQLGRPVLTNGLPEGQLTKQQLRTKSRAGKRDIPLPDFVLDELVLAKERYADKTGFSEELVAAGYIWHQETLDPHGRGDYKKPFIQLKAALGIPKEYNWHRLRHAYATLLESNRVNTKELANILGHVGDGTFSVNTYVDKEPKICEGVPDYFELLEDLLPIYGSNGRIILKEKEPVRDLPPYEQFLENLFRDVLCLCEREKSGKNPIDETEEVPL